MSCYDSTVRIICGIDEAGRGPLAGPVTAGAVVLPQGFPVGELGDSKSLSPATRSDLAQVIMEDATGWHLGWAWPKEIDRLNIHHATLLAMKRAFGGLKTPVDLVLVDGRFVPALPIECRAIVKGDTLIPEIMAASIIAKWSRDRWMERYSWIEPRYGFDQHKGYPTRQHRAICSDIGLSPIHRRSFAIRS